ncbi:MAG: amidohydrolase family protein [Anaerolineales bacterium]|jgi:predicted amidohydrolase YtcJ
MVSALAVLGERVLALGGEGDLGHLEGPATERVDLGGRTVVPGLVDAHLHLEWLARSLEGVPAGTPTLEECLRRVAARARETPPGLWITGHGWNQNDWGGRFGTARELDEAAPLHPVYLTAKSGHAAWVNHLTLERAGVCATTPDPQGGRIGRDEGGQLNGLLFEKAMQAVESALPQVGKDSLVEQLRRAQQALLQLGLTGVHDFDGSSCLQALRSLHEQGQLDLRVVKNLPVELLESAVAEGWQSGRGDSWLRLGSLKMFADGALGPQTAALLEPYEGNPGNRGVVVTDKAELLEKGRRATTHGLSLAVHAIGDRANRDVLDVFAALRAEEARLGIPASRRRHRVEHLQLLSPQDLPRPAQLGLVVSMQPIHATSDMLLAERHWGSRCSGAYAWRSQRDLGAVLAFGSDAPVESANPFLGLHAAVTRRRLDGAPGPAGWYPHERLSLEEALEGYTQGPAFAAGLENDLGSLSPGKLADLLVLDGDLFSREAMEIAVTRPLGTMVGGVWKWRDF